MNTHPTDEQEGVTKKSVRLRVFQEQVADHLVNPSIAITVIS